MENQSDKGLLKVKVATVSVGLLEKIALIVLLVFIASNIKAPSEGFPRYDANNEMFMWLACVVSSLILVLILGIVGAIKENILLMVPSVGVHITGLVFICIIFLTAAIRTSSEPMATITIFEVGTMSFALVGMLTLPSVIYLRKLITAVKGKKEIVDDHCPSDVLKIALK